ncbi:uncharacterized protein LOC143783202 [Ranitomeya variabilis]|uniref:uncharacterized protein LOC143783202 n=1 Tax=Ranitomeya variabilis TaxID=490064 RepID=UPI004056F404
MFSGLDNSGASFLLTNSNLTLTELMDLGFVASVRGNSSPYSTLDHLDHGIKSDESPIFRKPDVTPLTSGGDKPWLSAEESGPAVTRSPLNPEGPVFEQSSIISETINQFNNSIVGVFYGDKVSTPYKEDDSLETTDPLAIDISISKLQDTEVLLNSIRQQKPASPMWEISEINSALEERTPSLEVSDLRFPHDSELLPTQPSASAPCAQWTGVKHKEMGHSLLQPFRYQRRLSASEIPITILAHPVCSSRMPALSPEKLGK